MFGIFQYIMASTQQSLKERIRVNEPPRRYAVVMHNDDVTTMDFVVAVLCTVFNKNEDDAVELMLKVHHTGSAVVGVYSSDVAHSKVRKATAMACNVGFPFKLTVQPE